MHVIPTPGALALSTALLLLTQGSFGQASLGFRVTGPLQGTDTYLVDRNGVVVHTWPSTFLPGAASYVLDDGSLLRSIKTPNTPSGLSGIGGGVQRVALDGTVMWDFRYDGPSHWAHHDLEPMPNGNVLMIAWDVKTAADAIAAGRDPAHVAQGVMRPDSVIEVQPTGPTTGNIVWEWHLWDHLVQNFDATKANFGNPASHPELVDVNLAGVSTDWNHVNSVKYDPGYDRIVISSFNQSEIWVIDHSTTTAQAAGHSGGLWGKGGDILYRYGNPQNYGAGTAANRVFWAQHSARFIPPGYPGAGNMTVFDNDPPTTPGSQVWEFTPPMDASGNYVLTPGGAYGPVAPVWVYTAPGFDSPLVSSAERLRNGNTLICSGWQLGWVFEVTPAGATVASFTVGMNTFAAHYVDRRLWADKVSLSGSAGGAVTFNLMLGSAFGSKTYYILGSGSGTTPGIPIDGHVLPLNLDDVLLFTFANVNTPLLTSTFGTLDLAGKATAALNLPPGVLGPPAAGHFAAAVVDPATGVVVGTSNPVPISITP